jgi:viroplasmin and RNaseH domain-containing protein
MDATDSTYDNKTHYTVWRGWVPGVYRSRKELNLQIKGFKGALYHPFRNRDEAQWAYDIGYNAWQSGQQRYKNTPLF